MGPFWTRRQVARHLGIRPDEVPGRGLLHITGRLAVEEAYPVFQFAEVGARRDVSLIGVLLARRIDQAAACDWFFRPNPRLRDLPPIQWLTDRGSFESVLDALPEPDEHRPGPPRSDIDDARAAWLAGSREAARVGFTAPWDPEDRP